MGTVCPCTIWHGIYRVGGAGCACHCHTLTPDEQADLAIVAARARQDRGDLQPMMWTGWVVGGERIQRVIPWELAVNLDPANM